MAFGVAVAAYADPGPGEGPTNMVEALQQKLDANLTHLDYAAGGHGYLPAVLRALDVSADSQVLVFSATSLQFDHINQRTPRAIYHGDDVAVGAVQDGRFIEIITTDKTSGVAFYTLDVAKSDKPTFERRTTDCMVCHAYASKWAPGMLVANTDTGPEGRPIGLDPNAPFRLTDDRTAFEDRYGGWYVTGTTGAMRHNGNVTIDLDTGYPMGPSGLNLLSLADRIDVTRYLQPGSDIVSLLVLEHRAGVVNQIMRINGQYRGLAGADSRTGTVAATPADLDEAIDGLVSYLTFTGAAPLPSPVSGTSTFAQTFAAQGPRDPQGRSLRQLDLHTRLFRYPLSFMIYSQAFDALDARAKDRVWRGLYDKLLGLPDGPAAIDILKATKPGLPAWWRSAHATGRA